MTKAAKLNFEVSDTLRYQYAELAFRDTANVFSIGVDLGDNQLNVYRQDLGSNVVVKEAPITPKKLRKFARALLALADQVDPPAPAPVVRYYAATSGIFYRQVDGQHLDRWDDVAWAKSLYPTIEAQQNCNGASNSWPITESELPPAARPA